MNPEKRQLESEANQFRSAGQWAQAGECYQAILKHDLLPMDRAKTLANVMQAFEKSEEIEKAAYAGVMAYKIIQTNRLFRTAEGAHLRGYVRGSLNRLREQFVGTEKLQSVEVVAPLFHVTNAFVGLIHTIFGDSRTAMYFLLFAFIAAILYFLI